MGNVYVTLGNGGGITSDDVTITRDKMLAGYKTLTSDSGDELVEGTMANRGAWNGSVGMNSQINIPAGFHNGAGKVSGPSITDRGSWGTSLGINGSVAIPQGYHNGSGRVAQSIPTMGAQTINPSASQQTVSCSGKYMTGNVVVNGVSNLLPGNIKKGVTVGGVAGTCGWYKYIGLRKTVSRQSINTTPKTILQYDLTSTLAANTGSQTLYGTICMIDNTNNFALYSQYKITVSFSSDSCTSYVAMYGTWKIFFIDLQYKNGILNLLLSTRTGSVSNYEIHLDMDVFVGY